MTSNLTWSWAAVRNTKPVLLWLDSDQELNRKDIEGFLFSPMGIHTPSYDQWFRRYTLSKLMIAAGILRWTDWRELTILNFWPRFKMKTPENLDTKIVDIFLKFSTNIRMPHSNKQDNGYGHWKTAWGEIFNKNLETDWVFEDGRRFGSRTEPRQQFERKEDALWSFPIRLHAEAGTRNDGAAESSWW
jgi:hypothetical protein